MATLFFESTLTGHHLEYLHHLYIGATNKECDKFIFAVPLVEWNKVKNNCTWPQADNIRWIMLDDEECYRAATGSMIKRCFKLSRLIKRIAIQEKVDKIKLISLAGVIPILPLILPKRIKLSGIIYKIYLRASKSRIRRWIDYFRYKVMAKSRSMGEVFILNDPRSADSLNDIYHTNRFISLADPVPEPDYNKIKNIREEFCIPASARVFLHFGAMDSRKGTLEILRAINLLTAEERNNKYFIFAGKIKDTIYEEFYNLYQLAKDKGANIIVKDEFCTYEYLYSLCYSSDCILVPYTVTDLSSGVLGYAAVFNKPVIGPSHGLIGELILDNGLGITIDNISDKNLAEAINTINIEPLHSSYAKKNTIKSFYQTMLGEE